MTFPGIAAGARPLCFCLLFGVFSRFLATNEFAAPCCSIQ